MGEQNVKIIIPLVNNCCTLCELCPIGTDPKQHLPKPGDPSERQELWARPKKPPDNHQTPSDPRPLSHWDTGWTNGPVTRKDLANGRKNKENLPIPGNPNVAIKIWTHPPTSPRLSLSYQLNREPGNTEEGNRTECPKTPSTSQALVIYPTSLVTVPTLGIAIIAIRALFKGFGVPVSIEQREVKVDLKISIEAAKSLPDKSRPAKTVVSWRQKTDHDSRWETYFEGLTEQNPSYLERSPYWDTGWSDYSVMRKILANNRMKEENLPEITETIARCINRLSRDFGVPFPTEQPDPKSSPNSQTNRKPDGTEGGSRTVNSKAPSAPPGTPTTVRALDIVITATRCQALSRDIGVPISIDRKVYRIIFEKLIRASESPPEESRPVQVEVS